MSEGRGAVDARTVYLWAILKQRLPLHASDAFVRVVHFVCPFVLIMKCILRLRHLFYKVGSIDSKRGAFPGLNMACNYGSSVANCLARPLKLISSTTKRERI